MNNEMMDKKDEMKNCELPKGSKHVKGNIAKTDFQKNQETPPFQGYNFFGTKPKWD